MWSLDILGTCTGFLFLNFNINLQWTWTKEVMKVRLKHSNNNECALYFEIFKYNSEGVGASKYSLFKKTNQPNTE